LSLPVNDRTAETDHIISSSNVTLANGGMAGGVWMFLIVAVGMFFCMLSMAEMASMWVSRNPDVSCIDP
jgi:amino acid permease